MAGLRRPTGAVINSGQVRRLDDQRAVDAIAAISRRRASAQAGAIAPARLGHLAPALLGHADTDHPLRGRCGDVPVPDEELPVELPEDLRAGRQRQPAQTSVPISSRLQVPEVRRPARRETDTMDTFVDSSWYYRATRAPTTTAPWSTCASNLLDAGRPVHRRHRARDPAPALLPLLDEGDARPRAGAYRRAVHQLLTQGMVLNEILLHASQRRAHGTTTRSEVDVRRRRRQDRLGVAGWTGPVEIGGIGTMSKSKNNGVDPQALIDQYGADTARFYMMFDSPPEHDARMVR